MGLQEALVYTLCDNFMGMLMIPIQGRTAVVAIKIFGGYPFLWVGICAIIGSVLATLVNWYFGRFIASACKLKLEGEGRVQRLFNFCRRYWYTNVFFASIPFVGPLLTGLAGVAKINKSHILMGALVSNVIFYVIFFNIA